MPTTPDSSASPQIQLLRSQARRLEQLGAHDRAEPLLAKVLALTEATPAGNTEGIVDALFALAQCRFNGGLVATALRDYQRLLGLLGPAPGEARAAAVQEQVRRCQEALRQRDASAGLQGQVNGVVLQARGQRAVGETAAQRRVRTVARRLLQRGRVAAGAKWMQRWLDLVCQGNQGLDDESLTDLRDHAIALWDAGHPQWAAPVLRCIVVALQQHQDASAEQLAAAVRDWGACLAATGQQRSGQEALALARSLSSLSPEMPRSAWRAAVLSAAQASSDGNGASRPAREPWMHRLLPSLMDRCCFGYGLEWRGATERMGLEIVDDTARLRGAVRFDKHPQVWFDFELSTSAEADPSFPHIGACLRFPPTPAAAEAPLAAMRIAHAMTAAVPGVCAAWDDDMRRLALRSQVVFSGALLDGNASGDGAHALGEVALNMAVAVLGVALDRAAQVLAFNGSDGSKELQR